MNKVFSGFLGHTWHPCWIVNGALYFWRIRWYEPSNNPFA